MSNWETVTRILNIALGLIALGLMTSVGIKNWKTYTVKMKNYVMALGGFCALVAEANLEILFGFDTGPRVVLTTAVLLFTITGLLRHEGYIRDEEKPRPHRPPSR